MRRLSFPFIALIAACGDDDYDLYEADPGEFRTVTIWVDPHPDIPPELAKDACESWRPEGVLCALAPAPEEALIRIRSYDGECVEDEDGNYPLGHAAVGGEITLEVACLHRFGGTPISEDALWPTISHEVGHELGIWSHVPRDCDDPEVMEHPEAGPVCGTALMNPMINRGLMGITLHDHHAFELRDEEWSVLRLAPHEVCTFTARD